VTHGLFKFNEPALGEKKKGPYQAIDTPLFKKTIGARSMMTNLARTKALPGKARARGKHWGGW